METYFKKYKVTWLLLNLFMVTVMVVIGGITRITDSGLSMTTWNFLKGIVPPLNNEDWINLFNLYKEYPEYKLKNLGMSLYEFKKIFFWEYIHRIWGRLIGLTFFLPLIFIWFKGGFNSKEKRLILILSCLGFFQGFMGWYMVESGLIDKPDVSHFRLSAHLLTAFLIYSLLLYFFWTIISEKRGVTKQSKKIKHHKVNFTISLILLFITISAGAWVSGTDAGLAYNNFPLMGDNILPPILTSKDQYLLSSFLSDQGFLQFLHRVSATVTLLYVLHTVFKAKRDGFFDDIKILFYFLTIMIILQYTLGIIILKLYVPIYLGLMHQIGSLFMLTLLVISICECNKKRAF